MLNGLTGGKKVVPGEPFHVKEKALQGNRSPFLIIKAFFFLYLCYDVRFVGLGDDLGRKYASGKYGQPVLPEG